jgi:isoquinoline 1-oxidoreductase subunit beta
MSVVTSGFDRRRFLKTSLAGATGLIVGFYLPGRRELFASEGAPAAVNAFIHISPDDRITILVNKSEMGQGVATALPMLAAEELECDWRKVQFEFAPAATVYFDPFFHMQGTGGSTSIRSSWTTIRNAGASAREMLIAAAAQKWSVDPSECKAEDGVIVHAGTKRRASYGSLAEAASGLQPPTNVKLKDASQFKLIGKPLKRLDTPEKVNGTARFGIDARLPGMLHAVVLRCPVFGGKVGSVDDSKAKAVPGVKHVVQISTGIAVVADNTWNAMQGRRALQVDWDEGPNANVSTDSVFQTFANALEKPGVVATKRGDPAGNYDSAAQKVDAEYRAPYEAHATMEPMNCTADIRPDGADLWVPTQFQTPAQATAAKIAGVKPEQVNVHTTFLGGGFGRRGWSDYVIDACETSKAIGGPVQVTWSREDDMQHDYYRPASLVRFSAGLDANGKIVSYTARAACDSISNWFFPGSVKNGMDSSSVDGLTVPYDISNMLVDYQMVSGPIPQGFWRSVGASQNGFFAECFIDELAAAAKKDPYEFRRDNLTNDKAKRNLGVLNLVAEKAEWSKPLPQGHYKGIAVVEAFNTYVAEVAEISLDKDNNVKVHRVVVAVDLGQPVNPEIITQQVVGGVVYGLSQTLKGEITIDKGRVVQGNFDTFEVLRINEMPKVEVHLVPSTESPTGMGEPAVPPIAPAIFNAVFAATGKRIRKMPLRPADLA